MRRILVTFVIEDKNNRNTGFITENIEVKELPVKLSELTEHASKNLPEGFEVKNLSSISDITDILDMN